MKKIAPYKDIRSFIKLPDYFTITGLIFSILSIFYSIQREFLIAAIFIFISTGFDYLDGKFARKINRTGRFGVELDNLCDVVLYLLAIAIFGFMAGLDNLISLAVLSFFVITGILRLARFALLGVEDGYYRGLPVSFSIIIPVLYFVFLSMGWDIQNLLWFYLIPSFFMISTLKVRKKMVKKRAKK